MEFEHLDVTANEAVHQTDVRPPGCTDSEVVRLRLIVRRVQASKVAGDVLSMRCLRLRPDLEGLSYARAVLGDHRALSIARKECSRHPTSAVVDIGDDRTDTAK